MHDHNEYGKPCCYSFGADMATWKLCLRTPVDYRIVAIFSVVWGVPNMAMLAPMKMTPLAMPRREAETPGRRGVLDGSRMWRQTNSQETVTKPLRKAYLQRRQQSS